MIKQKHIWGIIITILFLAPLFFMVTGSLRHRDSPMRTLELLPNPIMPQNYLRAFELVDIPHYLINSTLISLLVVPITVIVASWAGFALMNISPRIKRLIIVASLIGLMMPLFSLLISRFTLYNALHLSSSYWPLILPAFMGLHPLYVLLFYWSFCRLPMELFETCRLEGMTPLTIWRRIAMPLIKPTILTVGALAFIATWTDFLSPLIYLTDERTFTAPLGLRSLATLDPSDYPLFLAGAVVVTLPVLIVFLLMQHYFLRGNTSSK